MRPGAAANTTSSSCSTLAWLKAWRGPINRPCRAPRLLSAHLFIWRPNNRSTSGSLDVRGDIYSLGAVGYFLVVGHPPFVAENPLEIMISHARDAVPPPSEVVPDLPSDVEAILLKCLSKNPEERFGSSAALGEALAACSVAGQWTRTDAARWWAEHQDSLVPGSATATDTGSFEPKRQICNSRLRSVHKVSRNGRKNSCTH